MVDEFDINICIVKSCENEADSLSNHCGQHRSHKTKKCVRPDCKSTAHGNKPFCIIHTKELKDADAAQQYEENSATKDQCLSQECTKPRWSGLAYCFMHRECADPKPLPNATTSVQSADRNEINITVSHKGAGESVDLSGPVKCLWDDCEKDRWNDGAYCSEHIVFTNLADSVNDTHPCNWDDCEISVRGHENEFCHYHNDVEAFGDTVSKIPLSELAPKNRELIPNEPNDPLSDMEKLVHPNRCIEDGCLGKSHYGNPYCQPCLARYAAIKESKWGECADDDCVIRIPYKANRMYCNYHDTPWLSDKVEEIDELAASAYYQIENSPNKISDSQVNDFKDLKGHIRELEDELKTCRGANANLMTQRNDAMSIVATKNRELIDLNKVIDFIREQRNVALDAVAQRIIQ